MSIEIKVPPLGESVTEASIAKWYKKVGDTVVADEILVELETDKVTLEVNAPQDGVITKIAFAEDDTVEIGDLLGTMEPGVSGANSQPSNNSVKETKVESSQDNFVNNKAANEKILSPAAKKIADEKNIDPNSISATGKDGRVTKGDVLLAQKDNNIETNKQREKRVKMSRLRVKIAQRLKESQNTAAILTTFNEVDMSNIISLRNKYKEKFQDKHGIKLGFMSFFAKASVAALKEIPAVNAEIENNEIIYKNHYDIGVAVGTEQGLVVPIVRDIDMMSFADIEKEIFALGTKARDGKLTVNDLTGGTFTISNGGVYGSLLSTPIINPPQSGILGMHKTQMRPVAVDGKVEIRPMMYLALSYDHRIIDGKEAVTFLVRVKELIENPEKLLFDL